MLVPLILQPHPLVMNKHKYDHQMKPQKSCQGYEDTTERQSTTEQWTVVHIQSIEIHMLVMTINKCCILNNLLTSPPGWEELGFQHNTRLSLAAVNKRSESCGHQATDNTPLLITIIIQLHQCTSCCTLSKQQNKFPYHCNVFIHKEHLYLQCLK